MDRTLQDAQSAEPVASFRRLGVISPARRFDVRPLNTPVASWSRFFDVAVASAISLGQGQFRVSPHEKTLASPTRGVLDQQALSTRLPRITASPPQPASRRHFARTVTRSLLAPRPHRLAEAAQRFLESDASCQSTATQLNTSTPRDDSSQHTDRPPDPLHQTTGCPVD